MTQSDLFGSPPPPHKTAVREVLLVLPCGQAIMYQDAYKLTRAIPNKPANWQANVRDELHRLWHGGYFTQSKGMFGAVYTRTDKA